ncbi:F-box only protein 8-like [Aegilops tauschii subsp. strangulata]|uniref:F-box only protein 8-like n=1 Tax=Aegilops tauschii subsp. strangulata TaxID=200361 RepID=UPI00098A6F6A
MAIKRRADAPATPPRSPTAKRALLDSPPPPPYLPSDVILAILSWLPPKSVLRFTSVCKSWQAMLSDPGFITAHLERSKTIRPSLLMVPCVYDPNDIKRNNEDSAFDMSFYRYRAGGAEELEELVVCNPATREFLALPERKQKHCVYTFPRAGLGFDPRSKKYKVARFFYQPLADGDGLACRFEVLTLGADSAWRQTADPPHWICGRTPAHANGHIYWTCDGTPARPDPPDLFLRFSLADEEFGLVPFPPSGLRPARLAELGGELCCVCFGYTNRELEVWSLGFDGGADGKPEWRWSRRWATAIGPDLVTELAEYRALRPPRVVLHEGAWLLTEERNVHRYDDRTGEIEKISSGVPHARYHYPRSEKEVVLHLTNYVESLVRIR